MHTFVTTAAMSLLAIAMALFSAPPRVAASESLLSTTSWEAFATADTCGSLAWSGEDETFSATKNPLGTPRAVLEDANLRLMTGLPAPEPPALVLAGMAFGGVLCGRSLLKRRKRQAGEDDGANETEV
jgi:hypothetical protein